MDGRAFDKLMRSIGQEASRRSILGRAAKGGLTALLAAIGIGTAVGGEVEAASCRRKCKRKKSRGARKRCLRKCGTPPASSGDVGIGGICLVNTDCESANCVINLGQGTCQACPADRRCGDGCCPIGLLCLDALDLCI